MGIIRLENIKYIYSDGTIALDNINLDIPEGKRIVFLGENGSGKSTLFLLLNGILKPKSGTYYFNGNKVKFNSKARNSLYKNIGLVFQDPDVQLFASTVYREISFGPKNMGISDAEVEKFVNKAMEQTGTKSLEAKPTHFLSYGQKKRVAVADILAMNTPILLMDEPFAWLDVKHQEIMYNILNNLHKEGKTTIISTHDPDFAWEWADYIYIIQNGRILTHGKSREIFENESFIKEAGLSVPFIVKLAKKLNINPIPHNKNELLKQL